MRRQKRLLFHAIPPQRHQPQRDWLNFLRAASSLQLPAEIEQLADNVWLLPEDNTYLLLSRLGDAHATETRILPFSSASDWEPLSPHRCRKRAATPRAKTSILGISHERSHDSGNENGCEFIGNSMLHPVCGSTTMIQSPSAHSNRRSP